MSWELSGNANINPITDFLGTIDTQPLIIKTNDTEAVRVTSDGKVGIGDSTPEFQLQVTAPNQLGLAVTAPLQSVGAGIQLQTIADDPLDQGRGWELLATGSTSAQGLDKFNIRDVLFGIDVITIHGDTHDNVGIHQPNPKAKLHVTSGDDFSTPQVAIEQATPSDFARLRFMSMGLDPDSGPRPFPFWDIEAGQGALNFFVQGTGNVMTLTTGTDAGNPALAPRVGIGTERPETPLHVNGTARVNVLEIAGGGDIAEPFLAEKPTEIEPGTVMVIDENTSGQLRISDMAYDRKVAGIVSGAGDLKPGLKLQQGDTAEGTIHVALTGRVYCKAEATSSPIEPGDLLTTSPILGHAMRAIDEYRSRGAILGKAMSVLKEGRGLVLVLVNLQ